eukprot:2511150-Karenia_brevis.AAC.1
MDPKSSVPDFDLWATTANSGWYMGKRSQTLNIAGTSDFLFICVCLQQSMSACFVTAALLQRNASIS